MNHHRECLFVVTVRQLHRDDDASYAHIVWMASYTRYYKNGIYTFEVDRMKFYAPSCDAMTMMTRIGIVYRIRCISMANHPYG